MLTADADGKLFFTEFFVVRYQGTAKGRFYQLVTSDGQVLEVTHHHIVFTKKHPNGVLAREISIEDQVWVTSNDQLILANVTEIAVVEKQGLYAPGTMDGTIIVNGVWASSYSNSLASHKLIHNAFAPLRWIYQMSLWLSPLYKSEALEASWDPKEGKHWYLSMMKYLQRFVPENAYDLLWSK